MQSKHTPGPWWPILDSAKSWTVLTHRDNEVGSDRGIGDPDGAAICVSIGDHTEARTRGNEHANACLIAAAPDLLEALKGVLRVADRATDEFDAARAAIAKAEGR